MAHPGLAGGVPVHGRAQRAVQRGPLRLPHRALGWGWEPVARRHSTVPKYEVAGVPATLREEFSRRSTAIEDAKNALVDQFARDHGREPTAPEVLKLRQTATLATRPGKQVRPLVELVDGWRARAEAFLDGVDPGEWAAGLAGRNDIPLLRAGDLDPGMLDDLAAVTLNTVGSKRATFTRANLLAEAARQLHGARFATAEDRVTVVAHVTDTAADQAVLLTPTATPEPDARCDRDGCGTPSCTPRSRSSTPRPASSTPPAASTGPPSTRLSPSRPSRPTCRGRATPCRPTSGTRSGRW